MNSKFIYHKDGSTLPKDGQYWVFVFGSNESGIHGAGAAKYAYETLGARWGHSRGFVSAHSYAIPTKDQFIKTLPLIAVEKEIEVFCNLTKVYDDYGLRYKWFITGVGCGLAGFSAKQIAPLFLNACVKNCSFPDTWKEVLESVA